jgi:hypothetical protein
MQEEGVIQGCPLGADLFALAMAAVWRAGRMRDPQCSISSYLDDGSVTAAPATAPAVIAELQRAAGEGLRLELCLHKCKAFSLNELTDEAHAELTGLGVQVLPHTGPDAGLVVVGKPVGTSAYQQSVVRAKVTEALAKLPIIERCLQRKPNRALPTAQGFNRLLRMCITAQLTHLLRTVPPCDWLAEAARFDRALYSMWARCIAGMPAEWHDADCPLAAQRLVDQLFLPLDGGGFSFTSARVALVGYIASWALVGQAVAEAMGPTALEGEGEQRRLGDDWVPGLVGALAQPALADLAALAQVNIHLLLQRPCASCSLRPALSWPWPRNSAWPTACRLVSCGSHSLARRTGTPGSHWRRLLKSTKSKMRTSACWCCTGCYCQCYQQGSSARARTTRTWTCTGSMRPRAPVTTRRLGTTTCWRSWSGACERCWAASTRW